MAANLDHLARLKVHHPSRVVGAARENLTAILENAHRAIRLRDLLSAESLPCSSRRLKQGHCDCIRPCLRSAHSGRRLGIYGPIGKVSRSGQLLAC